MTYIQIDRWKKRKTRLSKREVMGRERKRVRERKRERERERERERVFI